VKVGYRHSYVTPFLVVLEPVSKMLLLEEIYLSLYEMQGLDLGEGFPVLRVLIFFFYKFLGHKTISLANRRQYSCTIVQNLRPQDSVLEIIA